MLIEALSTRNAAVDRAGGEIVGRRPDAGSERIVIEEPEADARPARSSDDPRDYSWPEIIGVVIRAPIHEVVAASPVEVIHTSPAEELIETGPARQIIGSGAANGLTRKRCVVSE